MDAAQIATILNVTLPDRRVLEDLSTKLQRLARSAHKSKEMGDEVWRSVPEGASLDIVTKAFYSEYYEGVGFATYKVLVAIGGLEQSEVGMHKAKYCFATLHYDDEAQLITVDFHRDFR
ncbi:hypothetical protein CCAX7_28090 [Capsulimonas corticalis]|uniref:Uncharacterized protein n=1 Tax=Capsulimonas corticalis TaxID=2219043 RepID=A0A402CTG1_9BACT|nr:hypothetical protein [Capsulimonas corticalis]BDI30758.1 hypothetical protein CCAX7_28090 [Capsulimonas corticalis]